MQRVPLHSGFVSPCEARLALAQCGVALTAAEALVLGDVLAGGAFGERLSTRSQWAISELLEAMDVAPLAGGAAGAAEAVSAWAAGARRAIAEYTGVEGGVVSDAELLRYMVAPAEIYPIFTAPAVANLVDASLARHRLLAKRCAALDKNLPSSSGGSGGSGCLSVTNVKYAAKMAGCAASLTTNARLAVLADAYPAPPVTTTAGSAERCVDWRAMLDGRAGTFQHVILQSKHGSIDDSQCGSV
jgi:hypothetical protein